MGGREGSGWIWFTSSMTLLIDGVDDGPRLVSKGLIGADDVGGRLRNDCEWEQESWNDDVVK